jgi:hypothetical protein
VPKRKRFTEALDDPDGRGTLARLAAVCGPLEVVPDVIRDAMGHRVAAMRRADRRKGAQQEVSMVNVVIHNLSGFDASVTVGTNTQQVPKGQNKIFSATGQTIFRATTLTNPPKTSEAFACDATNDMSIDLSFNGNTNQLFFVPIVPSQTKHRGTE